MKYWSFFLIFLFSGFHYSASAQQIRNAFVIGATASQIDGDRMAGFNKGGLQFGGSSNFKINKNFSFQAEILFLQKGSKSTDDDSLTFGYLKWRLNYISIPVLVCYKIKPRFTLIGGMSADHLLSANLDVGFGFDDRSKDLKKLDLNYTGGFEFMVWENLGLNLKYQYSVKWLEQLHFKNSNVLASLRFYLGGPVSEPEINKTL